MSYWSKPFMVQFLLAISARHMIVTYICRASRISQFTKWHVSHQAIKVRLQGFTQRNLLRKEDLIEDYSGGWALHLQQGTDIGK